MFARWLQRQWFERRRLTPALWLFLPLVWLYALLSAANRLLARPRRLPVPVVVVGNITVGGAGKTPLTLWLARQLQQRGWRPGIVSRGYGRSADDVRGVLADSRADEVGDEPLLLARRSGCPVWVGRRRAEAGVALLAAHPEVSFKTGNLRDERNPDVAVMLASGQIKFHLRTLAEVIEEELVSGAVVPVPAGYYDQD